MLHNTGPFGPNETPVNMAAPVNMTPTGHMNIVNNINNLAKLGHGNPPTPSAPYGLGDYAVFHQQHYNMTSQMAQFSNQQYQHLGFQHSYSNHSPGSVNEANYQNGLLPMNLNLHGDHSNDMLNYSYEKRLSETVRPEIIKEQNLRKIPLNIPQIPNKSLTKQPFFNNDYVQNDSFHNPNDNLDLSMKAHDRLPLTNSRRKKIENTVKLIENILIHSANIPKASTPQEVYDMSMERNYNRSPEPDTTTVMPINATKISSTATRVSTDSPKMLTSATRMPTDTHKMPMSVSRMADETAHMQASTMRISTDSLRMSMSAPRMLSDPIRMATSEPRMLTDPIKMATNESRMLTDPIKMSTNESRMHSDPIKMSTNEPRMLTDPMKMSTNESRMLTDPIKMSTNEHRMLTDPARMTTSELRMLTEPMRMTVNEPKILTDPTKMTTNEPKILTDPLRLTTTGPKTMADTTGLPTKDMRMPINDQRISTDSSRMSVEDTDNDSVDPLSLTIEDTNRELVQERETIIKSLIHVNTERRDTAESTEQQEDELSENEDQLSDNEDVKPIGITLEVPPDDQQATSEKSVEIKIEKASWTDTDYVQPFFRDCNAFQRDEALDYRIIDGEISTNEAKAAIKANIKSEDCYECPHCCILFKNPKRFLIHTKWHTFGLTNEKRIELLREREEKKNQRKEAKIVERMNSKDVTNKKEKVVGKTWPCKDCDKVFSAKGSLKNHRQRTHPTRIRECRICHKSLVGWIALRNHMATHAGEAGVGFQCHECPKRFKYSHSLAKHSDTHLEKTHACQDCPKKFGSQALLKMHMKTHERHMRGATFRCTYCAKGFFESYSLQVHERTHRNERPYLCEICNTSFGTNSSLKRHLKVSHSTSKPYECSVCHRSFSTEPIRDRHEQRLHGKPEDFKFPCKQCACKYMKLKDLQKHVYKAHPKTKRKKKVKVEEPMDDSE